MLVGDFKSVQSLQVDRLGPRGASCLESSALRVLLAETCLSDARHLRDHVGDDEVDTSLHILDGRCCELYR